uniref:G-protein coupled receptors family 1 profile domain-containing protein n=1 Tax=Panagrolaimus sp. PS1159 TaxID=55785 RepID=A0AC35G729_9BILA
MRCDDTTDHSLLVTRFTLVAACGGAIALFGVIANAALAKLFVSKSNYRHSPFFFLGFVAIFDTLLDITYILLLALPIASEYFRWPEIYSFWIHNARSFYIIGQIFKISSVFCLIAASFERYLMTKHWTFTGFEYRSRWILLVCVIFFAIFVKLFTAMEIVIITRPECDVYFQRYAVGQLNNRSWLSGFLNMLTICIPFVTLIFLNGGIVWMLRQQNIQQLRSLITELTMGHDVMKIRRRNLRCATNTLIVIITAYLISNLLNLFLSLVEYLKPGLLQHQYPYAYRLSADLASLFTVVGNALRCPAHVCSNKDIRIQLFDSIIHRKPKPQEKNSMRRQSEKLDNPAWISVLLINHDDDKSSGTNETSACIRKNNGLQAVFERDNIRRLSNIGIC